MDAKTAFSFGKLLPAFTSLRHLDVSYQNASEPTIRDLEIKQGNESEGGRLRILTPKLDVESIRLSFQNF